jgi:hypothetical protein
VIGGAEARNDDHADTEQTGVSHIPADSRHAGRGLWRTGRPALIGYWLRTGHVDGGRARGSVWGHLRAFLWDFHGSMR